MSETKDTPDSTRNENTSGTSIPWEKIAGLLGAVSGLSLFLSIIFEMGYFDTIGLRFADVPTTIGDHVRSALLWAPQATAAAFVYMMIELIQRRFGSMLSKDGLALSGKQSAVLAALRTWTYRGLIASAFLVVWADALTGGQFAKYAAMASTVVVAYIAFSSATHIASGSGLSSAKLLVLCFFPVVTMLVYNSGVAKAVEERTEPRKATITLDGQREVQLNVYRYLDRGVLAVVGEGQLVFYRWEEINKLASTFQPPKRVNWLCQTIDVACAKASKPAANPASATRP